MREINNIYFQEGNTVRVETPSFKQQAYQGYRYQTVSSVANRPLRNLPNREQRDKELKEERERQAKEMHRRQVAAMRRSRLMTVYMIVAVALASGLFVGYVSLQNEITTHMKSIAVMENQLSEVKADNKVAESRIATSTNLTDIKNSAINDLGMVYATSSQIVYYSMDADDYMSQYKDIP